MTTKHERHLERQRTRRMSMNGHGNTVPPDLEWSEGMVLYACSQYTNHAPFCDGTCDELIATPVLIDLMNESFAWLRAGMVPTGLPSSLANVGTGIHIELLDIQIKVSVLEQIVLDSEIISADDLVEKFRIAKIIKLRNVRLANEKAVREANVKQAFAIPNKPGLFGPDGNPLG